jgi:hypothetical protein
VIVAHINQFLVANPSTSRRESQIFTPAPRMTPRVSKIRIISSGVAHGGALTGNFQKFPANTTISADLHVNSRCNFSVLHPNSLRPWEQGIFSREQGIYSSKQGNSFP